MQGNSPAAPAAPPSPPPAAPPSPPPAEKPAPPPQTPPPAQPSGDTEDLKKRIAELEKEAKREKMMAVGAAATGVGAEAAVGMAMKAKQAEAEAKRLREEVKKKPVATSAPAASTTEKVAGKLYGPAAMFIVGGFLWFLLNNYGFRTLANWVLVCVISSILISVIFKEPRKSYIVFLLPVIIWFLDTLKMLTPVNSAIAICFVLAVILMTFNVFRDFINKALIIGAYVCGGIIIFWMSAWAQMQLGNAYPHIISTILMIGYFGWVLSRKGSLKWAALVVNFLFLTSLFLIPSWFAGNPGSPLRDAVDAQLGAWNDMFAKFGMLGKEAYKAVETNYLLGIGNYEEGVEAESQKPLGVFLENVGVTSQLVSPEDKIDVFARLRAESFKTKKNLTIKVKCYEEADESIEANRGMIMPQNKKLATFSVQEYESQDIDCIIDAAGRMGSQRIILDASFTFTTSAFLKAYFMEQDRIRAYRRQNTDPNANPLDQFGITDKNPVAVFTGGPLKIGMGVAQQPIPLLSPESVEGGDYGPTLGITLDRNWYEGELLDVSEFKITAPPGLIIKDIDGTVIKNCGALETGEYQCSLGGELLKFFRDKPVRTPKTLRVHTSMKDVQKGIETLLAGAPMAIRSFKVEVTYTYRIKKEASVTVREAKK